jgi:hypothetical protein
MFMVRQLFRDAVFDTATGKIDGHIKYTIKIIETAKRTCMLVDDLAMSRTLLR